MKDPRVASAFLEHGPWISRFLIDGAAYGGAFDAMNDSRLAAFFGAFPNVATILELGSLEGGHTISLARHEGVKRVVGVEGRAANLARARFVSRLFEVRNVEFVEADLEHAQLGRFGEFDAIFCSGLLYHLPEPWKLLRQLATVSSRGFFWTHYCDDLEADTVREGYKGRMQIEQGLEEPLSGLSPYSFWPTLGSLLRMLTEAGYSFLRILENDFAHSHGPAVMIAAEISVPGMHTQP